MRTIPRALTTGLLAVLAISLAGCATGSSSADPPASSAAPAATPAPSASPPASISPSTKPVESPLASAALLDTDTWTEFTSDRYGYSIRYPADWVPDPADHDWTVDEAPNFGSTGHERFRHPDDDVGVSTWAYDPGPDVSLETTADLVAWAEDFCRLAVEGPCDGIEDRAVPLCREVADCHPAVLVQFSSDTYAFIPGYAGDGRMLIAAVWRPEEHGSTRPYGGSRKLLEAYLSTINGGGNAGVVPAP